MTKEFDGDLAGAVFWAADLRRATFRDVDLTGVKISHARLVDVEIDALVERMVVNGVDVTDFVNERDEWYPLRAMLRPTGREGMQVAWSALEREWAATIARATSLREPARHESVAGEWSIVETLRHVVFAIDKWCTVPLLGGSFHPMGLPNSGSANFPWPGLDPDAAPSFGDALQARDERVALVSRAIDDVDMAALDGYVEVLENGPSPRSECFFTVFEEAFWHNRYARRDIAALGG